MLNKVTEYRLLQCSNADDMSAQVNQAIRDGWVPSGTPLISEHAVTQAMVKFGAE
jgi:hypothetical protein